MVASGRLATQLTLREAGLEGEAGPVDIITALAEFGRFPYQWPGLSGRNWGHPLHSLCSYPSKMKPAMAATLVRLFTRPGDTVLDPFAGVGTLPFEACAAGRIGLASDLSPFAFGVSAAKVRLPSAADVESTMSDLAESLESADRDEHLETAADAELEEFFHPRTWAEVRAAREFFLRKEHSGDSSAGHWLVRAALAHILHGNRPYALSRRSHGIIPIPPKGPVTYKPVMPALREKLLRTKFDSLPDTFVTGKAFLAAAQRLPLDDASVSAVITSPPFLGTTDFLRQNRVRLWFYGMDYTEQRSQRRGSDFLEGRRDLGVYAAIFAELARVVQPSGLVVLHLGVVRGRDMAQELAPLARQAGFDELAVLYEDATHLESHGRTARGSTAEHQFLFLQNAPTS